MTVAVEHERAFDLFGSRVRLLVGAASDAALPAPELAAVQAEAFLRLFHRRLSRFESDSDLSRLNRDPAEVCEVSPLLATAVQAMVWVARESAGLVDSTLVGPLERAGYATSRAGMRPASLRDALAAAPSRRPASPDPRAAWRKVAVDPERGNVSRPAGMRLDSGGVGKGLAADLVSAQLAGYELHVVDAGGDLRIGGTSPRPRLVEVENPLGPDVRFELTAGAVATSGIATRVWRHGDGYAHHLLDPATGEPAWTGVVQATALADTALRAETLAKMAFLAGPERGLEILGQRGGILVLDDGSVLPAGPLPPVTETPVEKA
jgi:thiamine biosynthesis lipoprotein